VLTRPAQLNLSNWRRPPFNRWAFHHVREIIPSQSIDRGDSPSELPVAFDTGISQMKFAGLDASEWSLAQWLGASNTDALLVARRGKLVQEWYADADIEFNPHIVFSVSKSITATLAGVLVEQGLIDPRAMLGDIIPQLGDSGFSGATLQQLLDMAVNIDFEEDYEATSGKFVEYRTATAWHPCGVDEIDVNLRDFLCSLKPGKGEHGRLFDYKSPNSDLLGWILERAGGESYARLLSKYLWQPMGAEANAYITVDRKGAARTAGGICVLPRDLLRFGEMMRNGGFANGQQVVPASWVKDCNEGGDREAWLRSPSSEKFPGGKYRNQWYQSGNRHQAMLAIGIHSQWIYIDPVAEVTIVKLSAQDDPLNPRLGPINLQVFGKICGAL
jgi:CubicO group peptidase (beta-lactamase class C family)